MTKPDWCPEDVWLDTGMAFGILYDAEPDLEGGCEQGVREMAARAAMNERERCACKLEAMAATYLPGGPMDAKGGLSMGAAALRAS